MDVHEMFSPANYPQCFFLDCRKPATINVFAASVRRDGKVITQYPYICGACYDGTRDGSRVGKPVENAFGATWLCHAGSKTDADLKRMAKALKPDGQ